MAKTSVDNMLTRIKRRVDYDITDDDLDNILIDGINDGLKLFKQWFKDAGVYDAISDTQSFKTIAGQSWVDITKAHIVGDVASFTGTAGDTIDLTIDGTAYADIDIAACTTIALVVTAINTIVGSTVAVEDDNGFLQINSLTTGSTSSVTIADGTSTAQTVIAELFSVEAERTQSAIIDVDTVIRMSDRGNDITGDRIAYQDFLDMYADPDSNTGSCLEAWARFEDRFYFAPTPSEASIRYIDYIIDIVEIDSGDTLPFSNRYDPLVYQFARVEFFSWKFADDPNNPQLLREEAKLVSYKKDLITFAGKNFGQEMGTTSRKDCSSYPSPRKG